MPFTLSTLISARARFHKSPSSSPDRLHPVLVAADQHLASVPVNQESSKGSDGSTQNTPIMCHLNHGCLSPRLDMGAANASTTVTNSQTSSTVYSWITGIQDSADQDFSSLDDSYDISEVVIILDGDADTVTCENGRPGFDLAPLASETLKQELYTRGYLKKPTTHNVVPQMSRIMFSNRNVFSKVLGRRLGRTDVECLKEEQDAAEKQISPSVGCAPHAGGLESPWMDVNTPASESFDFHEFSYITAFTTPPSSPSIDLTLKKGVDGQHAV